jgi:4-amino-4-deoxy-L-arabinose transferase-like glycosyltransferase
VSSALITLLRTGSSSYRWAAAMTSASGAAPYQLASGEPIMAIGGFNGTDQSLTLAAFERLVSDHEVHYFIGGGGFGGGGQGGTGRSDDASTIQSWVESHFTSRTVGGVTVYDLTSRNVAG